MLLVEVPFVLFYLLLLFLNFVGDLLILFLNIHQGLVQVETGLDGGSTGLPLLFEVRERIWQLALPPWTSTFVRASRPGRPLPLGTLTLFDGGRRPDPDLKPVVHIIFWVLCTRACHLVLTRLAYFL